MKFSKTTVVVVHGSALSRPETARDIDVIWSGDRDEAVAIVTAWAAERGLSGLPLDMHESTSADYITIPRVPGDDAPYEVLSSTGPIIARGDAGAPYTDRDAGSVVIATTTYTGLASSLRMRATPQEIVENIRQNSGWRVRFALAYQTGEWGGYVDGPVALRSAIRHARANGVWDGLCELMPGEMRLAEVISRLGIGHLSAATVWQIGRAGGQVDVFIESTPMAPRGFTAATHARRGDAVWNSPMELAEQIEHGEPAAVA